jgi:hypothetical protein
MHPTFWLYWLASFVVVVSVLAILAVAFEGERMTAESKMLRALWAVIILVVVLAVGSVALASWAFAQEPHKHRPQDLAIHHKFYKTWTMPDNRAISCCHDDDCQPAEARRLPNGQWEARQEGDKGDFTPIPPRKVDMGLPDSPDAPDARAHLCGRRAGPTSDFFVYCFIAGQGG